MSRFILYHTAGCHLCEEAEALARACINDENALEQQDIAEDAELLARYSWFIPVLRNAATGQELYWPFAAAEIQGIL